MITSTGQEVPSYDFWCFSCTIVGVVSGVADPDPVGPDFMGNPDPNPVKNRIRNLSLQTNPM